MEFDASEQDEITQNMAYDISIELKLALPSSADFSKVIGEIFESNVAENQSVLEKQPLNEEGKRKHPLCKIRKWRSLEKAEDESELFRRNRASRQIRIFSRLGENGNRFRMSRSLGSLFIKGSLKHRKEKIERGRCFSLLS